MALFEPYRRFLKAGVSTVHTRDQADGDALESAEWVVQSQGVLYRIESNGKDVRPVFERRQGRRALAQGICLLDDTLFVVDCCNSPDCEPVHIYCVDLHTEHTQILHQFSDQSVHHVHSMEFDPHTDRLWISTGDADEVCQVIQFCAQNGLRQIVGAGSQKWRVLSFVFRPEAIYWGTGDPFGKNSIWRYDRQHEITQELGAVTGPVYHSKGLKDYVLFGTAVNIGDGEQDRFSRLYALRTCRDNQLIDPDQLKPVEIYRQPKDRWHPRLFGCGLFEFNLGDVGGNRFWATAKGLRGGLRSTLFELQ